MCMCLSMCVQLNAMVECVSERMSGSSEVQLFVIECLTTAPSSVHFDALTGTKTLSTIILKVLAVLCSYPN